MEQSFHQTSFVQLAANNNDLNEETIDGKNTTHATTIVVYQKRGFLVQNYHLPQLETIPRDDVAWREVEVSMSCKNAQLTEDDLQLLNILRS